MIRMYASINNTQKITLSTALQRLSQLIPGENDSD